MKQNYHIILLLIFSLTFSLKSYGQVIADPPCSATITYLGLGAVSLNDWSSDDPLPPMGFLFEICPTTSSYLLCDFGNAYACGLTSGTNCIINGYSCGGLRCFDCDYNPCIGACTLTQSDISDTIVLKNLHKIRFVQENFNAPNEFQATIDLANRCNGKDFGVKCKVAADGNVSTWLRVEGPNPSSIGMRVLGDPLDSLKNGYLHKFHVTPTIEVYEYYSPDGYDSLGDTIVKFEVFDINCPDWVLATFEIRKYQVPVLMLHGINSNGTTWDALSDYLVQTGFNPSIISKPSIPNDQSFASSYTYLNPEIQSLLSQYRSQGININQVNVIGHSMGGILGRYHLQSDDYINQMNINKLITVNTPHSGSEFAHILYDAAPLISWLKNTFVGIGFDVNGGAVENLRVNSSAMMFMNSSIGKNNSKRAPIHSVSTDYTGCTAPVNISLALGPFVAMADYYGYLRRFTRFNFNNCPQDYLLGPQNDIIVRLSSQIGGLSGEASKIFTGNTPDYAHSSLRNTSIHSHILQLLKAPTKSNQFTLSGFDPDTLPPPYLTNDYASDRSVVDISIDNLQNGDIIYNNSAPQYLITTGSSGVLGTMVMYHFANGEVKLDSSFQSSNSFIIDIPIGYTGRLDIGVIGTDGSGTFDFENIYLTVAEQPLPVELLRFDAKDHAENVKLNWVTASEINCDNYEVMHSIDGHLFSVLSRIECLNSTNGSNYQYLHNNPNKGANYYRLKQIDNDGAELYSKIVSIDLNPNTPIQIFPNPTTGLINIQMSENQNKKVVLYTINNQLGQIMSEGNLLGNYLEIGGFPEGIYFVHFIIENELISFKVIKK